LGQYITLQTADILSSRTLAGLRKVGLCLKVVQELQRSPVLGPGANSGWRPLVRMRKGCIVRNSTPTVSLTCTRLRAAWSR
jgi:hypothetical protein